MTIDVVDIIVILVLAALFWIVNNKLNRHAYAVQVVRAIIIVLAVLALLVSFGWLSGPEVQLQ